MRLRDHLRRLLGDRLTATIDFMRFPEQRACWGGSFNGQRFRRKLFFDLLYHYRADVIVETGTYLGATTELFAASGVPVHSVEFQAYNHAFSRARFFFNDRVTLYRDDSRSFLRTLAAGDRLGDARPLFYLDAHWRDDLPLRDELDIVFTRWPDAIVMVDDFCVPGSDYGFDAYSPERTLDLDHIKPQIEQFDLVPMFPAIDVTLETSPKISDRFYVPRPGEQPPAPRGCLVLVGRKYWIDGISSLRSGDTPALST
ncbi:hypothetical protein OAS86_00805 [Gammaproteobacteria bacterium]|nr:hypothetical protein [Gammaproteobacteria bacterium]